MSEVRHQEPCTGPVGSHVAVARPEDDEFRCLGCGALGERAPGRAPGLAPGSRLEPTAATCPACRSALVHAALTGEPVRTASPGVRSRLRWVTLTEGAAS